MSQEKDFYKILGVSKGASQEELKAAYKTLVRRYHPDLNPGDQAAEDKFKEVAVAFEVLGDEQKRKLYDEFGMAGVKAGFDPEKARAYQQFSQGNPFGGGGFGGGVDIGSLFEQMFQGRNRPRPTGPSRGADIEHPLDLAFMDAVLGVKRSVSLTRPAHCGACHGTGSRTGKPSTCPTCHGAGQINRSMGGFMSMGSHICNQCGGTGEAITQPCTACRGSGVRNEHTDLDVTIPPGISEGSRIRLSKKGAAGKHGGPPGDLYLIAKIRPHKLYQRDGNNLLLELPLSAHEAYNGAEIELNTPDGSVMLRVPPRSQSGQKLRLRGKGVKGNKKQPDGHLLITLKVLLPSEENSEVSNLLEQLQTHYTQDLREHLKTL